MATHFQSFLRLLVCTAVVYVTRILGSSSQLLFAHPTRDPDLTRRQSLNRWPFPSDVQQVLADWQVDVPLLLSKVPVFRAGTAEDVDGRLQFLTQHMRKDVECLQQHPQFLWGRFEGHILPRALYAYQLGVLEQLDLNQLLGTRDTALVDSRAWPAVCGTNASRPAYEALFAAVQQHAASQTPLSLLTCSLQLGLSGMLTAVGPPAGATCAAGSRPERRHLITALPCLLQFSAPSPPVKAKLQTLDGAYGSETPRIAIESADSGARYRQQAVALLQQYDEAHDGRLITLARIDCLQAININLEDSIAYGTLGEVWKRDALASDANNFVKVKWRQAADAFREASEAAPSITAFRLKQALALFEAGDDAAAQDLLADVLHERTSYTEAWCALLAIMSTRGNIGAANGVLGSALKTSNGVAGELQRALQKPEEYARRYEWAPRMTGALTRLSSALEVRKLQNRVN